MSVAAKVRQHLPIIGSEPRRWAPFVLIGLAYWILLAATLAPHLIAHKPVYWAGWADQGQYLRSARAFAAFQLSPSEHWYPLLYPLMAAPFTLVTPYAPFAIPDFLCVLAAFAGFRRVAGRFGVAIWPAAAVFGLTTLLFPPIAKHWTEPWTTTLSAALLWLALSETLAVLDPGSGRRSPARNAALGCLLALIVACRPADALVSATLGLFLLKRFLIDELDLAGIGAMAAGALATGASYLALHLAIYGPRPSDYMLLSADYGLNLAWLPWKAYLVLVEPRPWYPDGYGLLLVCPWILFGAAGLIVTACGKPGTRLAAACLAAVSLVYVAYTIAYVDLLPSGLWRYNNVHYFKWLLPLFGLFAFIFMRDFRRAPARSGVVLALLFALTCLRFAPAAAPEGAPARMLVFRGGGRQFRTIYMARSVITDRQGALRNFFEYHQTPTPDGFVGAVALKRDFQGSKSWLGQAPTPSGRWPTAAPGNYSDEPIAGPWPRAPLQRLKPVISLGLPCWLPPYPCGAWKIPAQSG